MLYTLEDKLRLLRNEVAAAHRLAEDAMLYAERTARLHHEAICRVNHLLTGRHQWPAPPDAQEASETA